jgi:hypothetical protein
VRAAWGMAFLVLVFAACSHHHEQAREADAGPDAGPPADAGPDAGPPDAGPPDAGPPDAGPPDAGPPDAGARDAGWLGRWETFGPTLGHEAQVYPAMALDASGAPLVAYSALVEAPGVVTTELHVVRWSGSAWDPLGGTITSSTNRLPYAAPLFVRLVTDGTGRPVLAFGDSGPGASTGAFPLRTWTFDGNAWQPVPIPVTADELGGIALGTGFDGQVRLVIATSHELHVLMLGAGGWIEELPPLADDAGVSEPDLALAENGAALVAFSQAPSPGSFGSLRALRGTDAGWADLGLPSPTGDGLLFHSPRIRSRTDGGLVVAASQWQFDDLSKTQMGLAVPVFALGEGGWSVLEQDGQPGGFALSEPIPGSPVDLQLENDIPVVVSTDADGGVSLRALVAPGVPLPAPVIGGLGAGTLLEMPDGTSLVGAVLPVSQEIGPEQADGGQVQIMHFTGTAAELSRSPVRSPR